jgi:hypothetical protein
MQDNVDIIIYHFMCTSINPDCVQSSQFNRDTLLGKLLALKVFLKHHLLSMRTPKVCLRGTRRCTLFERHYSNYLECIHPG